MKTMKHFQRALCAVLLILVCRSPLQAQTLTLTSANYTTYLEKYTYQTEVDNNSAAWRAKNTDYLKTVKKLIFDASLPEILFRDMSSNGRLRSLEELVLNDYKSHQFRLLGTKLRKVTIQNSSDTSPIYFDADNSFLSPDSIISDRKFYKLLLKRAKVTDMERIYSMLDFTTNAATEDNNLQLNGGKYNRQTYAGVDDGTYNPTNLIREIDMSRIPTGMQVFLIRHNLLTKVENVNHPNLSKLEINNNLLWSLDLNACTLPIRGPWEISPQKPYADLTVVKGAAEDGSGDEVRLYLPEGQSELFDNSRLINGSVKLLGNAVAEQNILGTATQKYFKLASVADGTKADLDLYAKHNGFSYTYNTRPNLTGTAQESYRDMTIEVKTYPYIMYIHPATKSGAGVNYYSGTLWLDYDAIVPKGTTVWIVTDIHKDKVINGGTTQVGDQLVMEQIGAEGDLIPAGTAMYVRSDTKAGLYDFQKAWTHDIKGWDGPSATSQPSDTLWYDKVLTDEQIAKLAAQRAKIGDRNLLEGYGTETTFTNPREALTLGRESQLGTGMIGFWPFNGTVVPAHRAFISEATYRRVTGDANAKGATFFFSDEGTTGITHINSTDAGTTDDAWYSLDGRRLTHKPAQKGLYIHKGRKEVIR